MKTLSKLAITAATAAIMTVAGCSQNGESVNNGISQSSERVGASLSGFGDRAAVRAGGAQLSTGIFMGATQEFNSAAVMLPAELQAPNAVRLESRDPLTLQEISLRLSDITGINHTVALGPTGSSANSGGEAAGLQMRPNLRGPLSEVLNQIGSTFEVEWTYKDGRILFQDYVTRQYQISALPTSTSSSAAIGSNGLSSSSSISTDVWAEIQANVDNLVGQNAKVSISQTTGTLSVTAKVGDHNRVSNYVRDLNKNVGQQITFDVNVLTVTLNNSDSFGINLEAAFAEGANAVGAVNGSASSGSVNIGVVNGEFSVSAIVNALSSQGQVAVSTRAGATTTNNRMAPIEIVDTISYLAETSVETADNGETSTSRVPGQATTGFQLQIFPRILNNNELMVQYVVKLSELNALRTFGDGADAIQLPEISTTSFEQQAVLKNGQTLVLAGFERTRAETSEAGIGTASRFGLGGSAETSLSKVATVMLITPRVIQRNTAVSSGR